MFLPALCELRERVFRCLRDLLRRSRKTGHGNCGEGCRPQRISDVLRLAFVVDHVHEAELFVLRDHGNLRIQIRKKRLRVLDAFAHRDGAVNDLAGLRRTLPQVLIHFKPRLHGSNDCLFAILLRQYASDLHIVVQNVLGRLKITGNGAFVKK